MSSPRFLMEWGQRGDGKGEFYIPIGIAINQYDEVIVTDFGNSRVQKFTTESRFLVSCPVLPNPGGIAVDASGNWYISHFRMFRADDEPKPDRISVYSPEGEFLREWGNTGTGDGEFDMPGGIAINSEGRVYVADQTNRRVQVFTLEGRFVMKWGEYGMKPGQFGGCDIPASRVAGPNFLALDRAGNLYTTEASMGRIQKFTAEGKFLLSWGDLGTKPGGFGGNFQGFPDREVGLKGPVGICVDQQDRVWVSSVNGRVQQFDDTGSYLQGLARGQGTEPGQFLAPHELAFDSRGMLYVADSFNNRIQKFSVSI